MDIVERLRLDRPCISDVDCCGDICIEAADEIERLREAMVEIVYLIGDRDRRQEVMDIAKPYAIQQLALKGNKPHVYLLDEEA